MTTKQQEYNQVINEMAEKLFDADFDEIKKQVAYMTSEESGYALGCDMGKVGSDVLNALTRIRAEREREAEEVERAGAKLLESGWLVIPAENVERYTSSLSELHQARTACDAALKKANRLIAAIDDMKYDCDGEVYETLLVIADILGR